jgi:RNA polymerase sigma-70 factor (ECF subfamily)
LTASSGGRGSVRESAVCRLISKADTGSGPPGSPSSTSEYSASIAGTVRRARPRAQLALLDGVVGAVWAPGGRPRVAFAFTTAHGRIVEIELLADPDRLRRLDLTVFDG